MKTRFSALVLGGMMLGSCLAAAGEFPVSVERCRVTRERIEGVVNLLLALKNKTERKVKIDVAVEFMNQLGKRMDVRSRRRVVLKPGASYDLRMHETRVQYFERYRVVLSEGEEKKVYLGSVFSTEPWEEPAEPLEGTWIVQLLGYEDCYIRRGGVVYVKVRVKNYGSLTATGVKAKVSFVRGKDRVFYTVERPVNKGKLKGWQEYTEMVVLRGMPPYDSVRVQVTSDTPPEPSASGGEGVFQPVPLSGKPVVEAGEISFRREKNALVVEGKLRNGLSVPVKAVRVVLNFRDKKDALLFSRTVEIAGPVAPGAVVPFTLKVEKAASFASYDYTLSYREAAP